MFDNNAEKVNLSGEATRSTMGSIASGLGWLALLVLALATAGHAVSITMAWANLNPAGGDLVAILALIGVALVEVFAVLIAVMYATHSLRAKQKPVAMLVEAAWFVFAAVNLISSFSMKHGGEIPAFVGSWVTYGLPVAGLIVGGLFYVVMRLDPNAARADDVAELDEGFERVKHNAKIEVLASPQMRAVIRQMTWQQLPPIIGRQMNLSEQQIAALTGQAPQLLDLNGNGVPDIQEAQARPATGAHSFRTIVDRGTEYVVATGNPATRPFGTLREDAFTYIGKRGFENMSVHEISRHLDDVDAFKVMRNNTHNADQDEPTIIPLVEQSGQGNGPTQKPLGADARNPTSRQ